MTTPMQQPKIDVQSSKLGSLLNDMAQGNLQIPRFQRKFVWSVSKTRELLDSMLKEFPIGTFFFWRAPEEFGKLFREVEWLGIPSPKPGFPVTYILDGQQRLTSLYVTINGLSFGSRDYSRICIDLKTATHYLQNHDEGFDDTLFVYLRPDNRRYVSLKDLLSPQHLTIFKQIPDEWSQSFIEVHNRFMTYPLSVVWVKDQPLGEVVEIFQRINQGGKRLNRYDLVCANLWRPEFDFRRRVSALNQQLKESGFGRINETIITQAFALILLDRCTTAAELSLDSDAVEASWNKVIDAIYLAIDFAEANLGVKRYDFLPYRGIIPVLAYYFYHAPKSAITASHRAALWQWFWRVTLSERYSSSSPLRMAEDAQKLRQLLQGEPVEFNYPSKVTAEAVERVSMTTASSALRNAILCMLALRNPKNLKDGSPVNLKHSFFSSLKKAERHHIFPVAFLKKRGFDTRTVHRIPNFCFIPADLNREISAKVPSQYLSEYNNSNPNFAVAASSHLIPIGPESPVWDDDYGAFLAARSKVIARELNNLVVQGPVESGDGFEYEGQEAEVVELVELRLRDLIDQVLSDVAGDGYWEMMIPESIVSSTEKLIGRHIARHPYEERSDYSSGRSHLDFCTVFNYEQIISANWEHFESVFGHLQTFQQHITAFREFRNAIAHNKSLDEIDRKLAEAAVKWIQQTLDRHADRQEIEEETNEDEVELVES